MRIDSHQHFWKYDPQEHIWIGENMSLLKRDYLPAQLKKELAAAGIDGSIAVQASQSEQETTFLVDLAREEPMIKGIVGWVDLQAPEVAERVSYFTGLSKDIKGFRHVIHDEPADEFMLRASFLQGIKEIGRAGLTYDLLVFPRHLPFALEVVNRFPDQKFVIDHLAKPGKEKNLFNEWKKQMKDLGRLDNVWCKISGLVTEASWHHWTYEEFTPYLDTVLEAFGPSRLMFGSDWPVCLLSASYCDVLKIVETYAAKLSDHEKRLIFGGTAVNFYNID